MIDTCFLLQVILKRNPRAIKDGVIGEVNRFLSQVLGSKFEVRLLFPFAGRSLSFRRFLLLFYVFFRFVTVVVGWL